MRDILKSLVINVPVVLILILGPGLALGDGSSDAEQAAQLFVAKVQGKVLILHGKTWHKAAPPEPLEESDRVNTAADSKAYLEFPDGGTIEIGPHSDMTVKQLQTTGPDFKARFLLTWGKFKAQVKKLTTPRSAFEVEAGGVIAGVRGTVFGVDYDKDSKQVSAQTYEGSIFTRTDGKEQVVEKGYAMAIEKTGLAVKSPLTGQQMNNFKDFLDISGQLEQKKQELMGQMRQKVMEKVPVPDVLKNTLGQHLPF